MGQQARATLPAAEALTQAHCRHLHQTQPLPALGRPADLADHPGHWVAAVVAVPQRAAELERPKRPF